jgi:hypothetical protein
MHFVKHVLQRIALKSWSRKIPFCQSGKIFVDPYSERIASVHFVKHVLEKIVAKSWLEKCTFSICGNLLKNWQFWEKINLILGHTGPGGFSRKEDLQFWKNFYSRNPVDQFAMKMKMEIWQNTQSEIFDKEEKYYSVKVGRFFWYVFWKNSIFAKHALQRITLKSWSRKGIAGTIGKLTN